METNPSLPNEILLLVINSISTAALSDESQASSEALRACRLVSSSLCNFSTPHVFRHVCLRRGLRSSIDTLEGLVATDLCRHVESLIISASACILEKFLKKHSTGEFVLDPGISKVLQSLEQFSYQARLWADEFGLAYSKFLDSCVNNLARITLECERFHGTQCLGFFLNSVGGGFGHLPAGLALEVKLDVLEDMRHLSNPTSLSKIQSLTVDCSGSMYGSTHISLDPFWISILSNISKLTALDISLRNVINQEQFKPKQSCIEHLTTLNLNGLLLNSDSLTTIFSSTPFLRSTRLIKVQIKESAETWENVFVIMTDLQDLTNIYFESLSYVDFWFCVEIRRITEYKVRRPLESSRAEDYAALHILRDTILQKSDGSDWFLTDVCGHEDALTVAVEIEDAEIAERYMNLVAWVETGYLTYYTEIEDML